MANKKYEDLEVSKICENYSEIINQLCSANYLLLNKLSKSKSSETIAKKGWFGRVAHSTGSIRNSYFLEQGKMLVEIRDRVFELFTRAKDEIVKVFNRYYKKNATFEDYFDGTEVKDYQYTKDSFDFCCDELASGDYDAFAELLIAHSNFIKHVENLMKYEAMVEIFNELSRYSSNTGKRIISFGIDSSPKNVGLITENEILKICVDLGDCHLAFMQDIKNSNDFLSLSRRQSLEKKAQEIAQIFQSRLVASNTPFDKNAHKDTQRMVDIFSSIKHIPYDQNYVYDKVFYNKNEILLLQQALNEMCCDSLFEKILTEKGTFDLVKNLLLRANGRYKNMYYKLSDVSKVDDYYLENISLAYYGN